MIKGIRDKEQKRNKETHNCHAPVMKEKLTTAQKQRIKKKKKKKKYDTQPLSPYPNPNINEPPVNFLIPHHLQ